MVIYQDFLNTCDPFCRGYDSLTYFQDLVGIYNLHHKWFNKPYFVCRLYFFKSWNFSINWYEFIWKLTRITIVVHANRIEWHLVVGLSWNNLALSRNSQLPPQVCQYLNLMILNQLRQLLIQSKDNMIFLKTPHGMQKCCKCCFVDGSTCHTNQWISHGMTVWTSWLFGVWHFLIQYKLNTLL